MILNIRSTNGGGKSTIVRGVLNKFEHRPIYGVLGPMKPEAYCLTIPKLKLPLYLLGPYITEAGGCDCIQPYDLIPQLIDKYAAKGHVLFEGVLVSKVKGQLGVCLDKYGKDVVLIFLDTTLEQCIASVQGRRTGRGDDRTFNPHNLTEAFKAVVRVRKTLLAEDKLRIIDIPRDKGVETVLKLLRESP